MARTLKTEVQAREQPTEIDASSFLGEPKKAKRNTRTISDSLFTKARARAQNMMASGDWEEALPRDFVALYAILHERVYGVEACELDSKTRLYASGMAKRLLEKQFDGDPGALAAFMRWIWIREKQRHAQRLERGDTFRISWKYQFAGGALVSDYRLHMMTHGGNDG